MLTRTLFLCSLLLVQLQVFAQEEKSKSTPQASKYTLKATFSDIVWSSSAMLPIGLEYKVHNKVGVTAELGIPLFFHMPFNAPLNSKTIKYDMLFGMDARYYFYQGPRRWGFVGLSGNYRRQQYSYENGGSYVNSYATEYGFSSADVLKQVYTCNVIFGAQLAMGSRFFWTFQLGLGGKFVHQAHSNVVNLNRGIYDQKFFLPVGAGEDRVGGNNEFFNLPWAIRLCYSL